MIRGGVRWNHVHRRHQAKGNRQVEMRPFLGPVSGREVDDYPSGRQRQADGGKSGTHPFPAFSHGFVGKTDNGKNRLSAGKLRLHIHAPRFCALKGNRRGAGRHASSPARASRKGKPL